MAKQPRSERRSPLGGFLTTLLLWAGIMGCCGGSGDHELTGSVDGRYSFSLTTFSPSGHLQQVARATRASTLGPPVVAMIYKDSCGATTTTTTNHVSRKNSIVLLASPHVTPTPLMEADGTARFCAIAPCIVAAHSGVGADGRVVLAAAQRMAVEHEYTFDEPIPISHFLEQTSLLFQEYTMKAGNRPFGCVLLIAHLPEDDDNDDGQPELYAIHPSGSVESLGQCGYIGAITDADSLLKDLESSISANTWNVTEAKQSLLDALQKDVQTSRTRTTLFGREATQENDTLPKPAFLTASFSKHDGLKVNRIP